MSQVYDLAIIGGGPAGLTAGLYAGRARLNVVMFDGTGGGGWLAKTTLIENYPGFPDGISGPDLADVLIRHASRFGLKILTEMVTAVRAKHNPKTLVTASGEHETRAVLVCTGSSPIELSVPGERELRGRGVSYCATCDAALFEGREVAVIGGGNAAVDEGLEVARFAAKVHVIHRRNTLRAEQILQERAFANPKMHFIWDTVVDSINGEKNVQSISLRDVLTGRTSELKVSGAFIFVGTRPNTEFVRDAVKVDERGYIVTNQLMETSVKGIWAAGDVQDSFFRQAITAAGQGASAAMLIERYLREHEARW